MNKRRIARGAAACTLCAALGSTLGLGTSFAKTRHHKRPAVVKAAASTTATQNTGVAGAPPMDQGPGPRGAISVHSVSEVLDQAGTAFIEQTSDDGTLASVDAGTLTITEACKGVSYGTATITVDDSATVTLDGKSSSLAALVAGDHVIVQQSSDGIEVMAQDASSKPPRPPARPAGPAGRAGGPPQGGQGAPDTDGGADYSGGTSTTGD